jgi:RNA polymerase sigma factor (sigma-70 family)
VEHYYFAGRSVFDIADELELSRENVKVRLHRARKRLEELLEERGYLW